MWDLQWYDYLRMVLAIAASAVIVADIRRGFKCWDLLTPRDKDYWWVFNSLLAVVIYGLIEAIVQDLPYGPKTFIVTCVTILVGCRAVFHTQQGTYNKQPTPKS